MASISKKIGITLLLTNVTPLPPNIKALLSQKLLLLIMPEKMNALPYCPLALIDQQDKSPLHHKKGILLIHIPHPQPLSKSGLLL